MARKTRKVTEVMIFTCAILLTIFSFAYLLKTADFSNEIPETSTISDSANYTKEAPPNIPIDAQQEDRKLVLIGILTIAEKDFTRSLIRHFYALQSNSLIQYKFVIGRSKSQEWMDLVKLENNIHDDILFLDIDENMNEGKTFTYFKTVGLMYNNQYSYIMKSDDDTFVNFSGLIPYLQRLPLIKTYFGKRFHLEGSDVQYMQGMAYGLSFDLVHKLSQSDYISRGPEDLELGVWAAKYTENFISDEEGDYYHQPQDDGWWEHRNQWTRPWSHDTVATHGLKTLDQYINATNYFLFNRTNY